MIEGRSGSGKSTFLNLLAGLDQPASGTIEVDGNTLSQHSSEDLADYRLKKVGIVFQFFNLLPTLTIYENVSLPGRLMGTENVFLQKRIQKCLDLVGITPLSQRLPHEVSGGEIQRAAIARAMINEPKIVLADEPTGNLDDSNREIVTRIFKDLTQNEKITLLVVTHDKAFTSFADSVYRPVDGKLIS